MNVPPPGRPKAGQFKPGEGEADVPASPLSWGQRREFAEHRCAPPEPAGYAKPAVGQGPEARPVLICGDIRGTKSLPGLTQDGAFVLDRRYANADFPDFPGVHAALLADTQTDPGHRRLPRDSGPIADDFADAALGAATSSLHNASRLRREDRSTARGASWSARAPGWAWPLSCRKANAGGSFPAKAVIPPSRRLTRSRWRHGVSCARGTAALPGSGEFRGRDWPRSILPPIRLQDCMAHCIRQANESQFGYDSCRKKALALTIVNIP